MSKVLKQMQMDTLAKDFQGVRDMVVLSVKGLACHADYSLRAALRKKKIRLQMVKNSMTRKVLGDMGLAFKDGSDLWAGPTTIAFGGDSIAQLSKDVEAELKNPKMAASYKEKVWVKGAIADGNEVTFAAALSMPTRLEAIAKVAGQILAPGGKILSQLRGPGGVIAGQIKQISEKKGEGAADAAAPAPEAAPAS